MLQTDALETKPPVTACLLRTGGGLSLGFGLALLLTACSGYKAATAKNFERALDAYFSHHDDCLYPSPIHFPYQVSLTDKGSLARALDALTAEGLLQRTVERGIQVKRYALTPYTAAHVDPRFCYGYRQVISIDSFTPPERAHGQDTSQVTYRYKMMDLASWTKSKQMLAAFPTLAKDTKGEPRDTTPLVLTVNGWQVQQ